MKMKSTATVGAVAGLIALSVVVATRFTGSAPATENTAVLELTDADHDDTIEIRPQLNPDVMPDHNTRTANTQPPAIKSNQTPPGSLESLAAIQTEELEAAAKEWFIGLENSDYMFYDLDTLRSLAGGMDSKAQMVLASKLQWYNMSLDDDTKAEARELLVAASKSDEPMAALTATRALRSLEALTEIHAAKELQAAKKQQATKERFLEFERSDYARYNLDTLRSLAEDMDSKAQIALATKLLGPNPDVNDDAKAEASAEALELLIIAAEAGEPTAAIMAAEISYMKNEPVRGYSYLLKFERSYGENDLVRRTIDEYPDIHLIPEQELTRRVQWYMQSNKKLPHEQ